MEMKRAVWVATLAALGVWSSGCPSSSCPLENPAVNANGIAPSCTATAGQPVTYQIAICPTCNQTSASCVVDLSAAASPSHDIYLDTKVESCTGSNSCPPSCQTNPLSCTFTAPAAGTYTVIVSDGGGGQPQQSVLTVGTSGSGSCSAPVAGI